MILNSLLKKILFISASLFGPENSLTPPESKGSQFKKSPVENIQQAVSLNDKPQASELELELQTLIAELREKVLANSETVNEVDLLVVEALKLKAASINATSAEKQLAVELEAVLQDLAAKVDASTAEKVTINFPVSVENSVSRKFSPGFKKFFKNVHLPVEKYLFKRLSRLPKKLERFMAKDSSTFAGTAGITAAIFYLLWPQKLNSMNPHDSGLSTPPRGGSPSPRDPVESGDGEPVTPSLKPRPLNGRVPVLNLEGDGNPIPQVTSPVNQFPATPSPSPSSRDRLRGVSVLNLDEGREGTVVHAEASLAPSPARGAGQSSQKSQQLEAASQAVDEAPRDAASEPRSPSLSPRNPVESGRRGSVASPESPCAVNCEVPVLNLEGDGSPIPQVTPPGTVVPATPSPAPEHRMLGASGLRSRSPLGGGSPSLSPAFVDRLIRMERCLTQKEFADLTLKRIEQELSRAEECLSYLRSNPFTDSSMFISQAEFLVNFFDHLKENRFASAAELRNKFNIFEMFSLARLKASVYKVCKKTENGTPIEADFNAADWINNNYLKTQVEVASEFYKLSQNQMRQILELAKEPQKQQIRDKQFSIDLEPFLLGLLQVINPTLAANPLRTFGLLLNKKAVRDEFERCLRQQTWTGASFATPTSRPTPPPISGVNGVAATPKSSNASLPGSAAGLQSPNPSRRDSAVVTALFGSSGSGRRGSGFGMENIIGRPKTASAPTSRRASNVSQASSRQGLPIFTPIIGVRSAGAGLVPLVLAAQQGQRRRRASLISQVAQVPQPPAHLGVTGQRASTRRVNTDPSPRSH